MLVIWIATPHFTKGGQTPVRLAMTKKILSLRGYCRSNPKYMLCFFDNNVASAHCVNNSKRSTQGVRHRRPVGKTPCYKKLDCFTRQRWTLVPFAMTGKIKIAHAVRHMAMTITKIFNSISFRDYSLLFIKKIH